MTFVNSIQNFIRTLKQRDLFISGKVAFFLRQISSGAYLHFLNVFLKDVGLSASELGFIAGIAYACMSLCGPIFGLFIDHTGRRKLTYACLTLYICIGVLAMPFVARATDNHSSIVYPTKNPYNTSTQSFEATRSSSIKKHPFCSNLFFAMLVLDITVKCVGSVTPSILDAAVMNILERKPTCTYGSQRMWGSIGQGIGVVIAGSATDRFAHSLKERGLSRYTTAFALAVILEILSLPTILYVIGKMKFQTAPSKDSRNAQTGLSKDSSCSQGSTGGPSKDSTSSQGTTGVNNSVIYANTNGDSSKMYLLFDTFRKVDNLVFILTVLINGICLMTMAGFLLIFMGTMNASDTVKGAAIQVSCWIQILILPFSDMIIRRVGGTVVAMEIGIASFCVRFVANANIRNPYLILATQVLHSLGSALFYTAVVAHTKAIAPTKIYVTTFSMVTGVYYGLGGLLGNLLGGVIYQEFGGKVLFLSVGVMSGSWVIVMILYFHVGRRLNRVNTIEMQSNDDDERSSKAR